MWHDQNWVEFNRAIKPLTGCFQVNGTTNKTLEVRIREAAAALKNAGAREVFIFGSAARGLMREGSDIDLAVTGLPPCVFFKAMGEAGDILKLPLDLIDLDENTPFTRYLREEEELVRIG